MSVIEACQKKKDLFLEKYVSWCSMSLEIMESHCQKEGSCSRGGVEVRTGEGCPTVGSSVPLAAGWSSLAAATLCLTSSTIAMISVNRKHKRMARL